MIEPLYPCFFDQRQRPHCERILLKQHDINIKHYLDILPPDTKDTKISIHFSFETHFLHVSNTWTGNFFLLYNFSKNSEEVDAHKIGCNGDSLRKKKRNYHDLAIDNVLVMCTISDNRDIVALQRGEELLEVVSVLMVDIAHNV